MSKREEEEEVVSLFGGWVAYMNMLAMTLESGNSAWALLEMQRLGNALNKLAPMKGATEKVWTAEQMREHKRKQEEVLKQCRRV